MTGNYEGDPRQEYTVTIGGVEHTLLLDDAAAKRLGGTPVQAKQRTPANKSGSAESKG